MSSATFPVNSGVTRTAQSGWLRWIAILVLLVLLLIAAVILWAYGFARSALPQLDGSVRAHGLQERVVVVRDGHGLPTIDAANLPDLFFAQGYAAARDRLFQFEIWRRQATGTVAQLLGQREVSRDIGARLFRFRGNLKNELNHYHPHGEAIIHAFTEGIKRDVAEVLAGVRRLAASFAAGEVTGDGGKSK